MNDPETGWVHRIDYVPEVGRLIEFRRLEDRPRTGLIVAPATRDTFWQGIGDDVRIKPDDSGFVLLIPSLTYTHWRYVNAGS